MPSDPIRSILVASDLGEGSDGLVRSAAALAELSGAELHVLHILDLDSPPYGLPEDSSRIPSFPGRIEDAERSLAEQVERTVPAAVRARPRVVNFVAHRAITEEASSHHADLIVLGAHRGGELGAEILGSTADRVIRTAEVPCLVLRRPLTLPIRRVGVPIDFSETSRGALRVAGEWAAWLARASGNAPELRLLHVASTVEVPEASSLPEGELLRRLESEAEATLPAEGGPGAAIHTEVRREVSPAAGIVSHARERELDLLVMGTHGRGGMTRLLIGSVASGIARQAACPVLLVPPSAARRSAAARRAGRAAAGFRKVLLAVDFSEASVAAADWGVRHFAPDAEHHFLHVLRVKEPPAYLGGPTAATAEEVREAEAAADARLRALARGLAVEERVAVRRGSPVEEVSRTAAEEGVDLVVVGPHARRGLAGWLGSSAESLLASSTAPVLLGRELPPGPPARILVAVDESERARELLDLGRALRERFRAELEVLFALDLMSYEPAFELVGRPSPTSEAARAGEAAATTWLRERALEAGIAEGEARLRVESGEPGDLVLDVARRDRAELIVMGSRGAGAAGRFFLGSVARRVLRHAPCPVLVLGDPARSPGNE